MSKKEKIFDEKLDKESLPFQITENLKAPEMISSFVRAKRGVTKKWTDYYAVMYCNWILLYPTTNPKMPKARDEPSDGIKLDANFSYKQVAKVDERIIVSGLIPKTKKLTNTMGIGPESEEWLVEFDDDMDMYKWIEKVRSRCKQLRKVVLSFGGRNTRAMITQVQMQIPQNHVALTEIPKQYEEQIWNDTIEELWNQFNTYYKDMCNVSLFVENFDVENGPYLVWFTSPGSAPMSLEKDLLDAEDRVVVNGWKQKFLNFGNMDHLVAVTDNITEKTKLVQECKYMIHLIDCYNAFGLQIHFADEEFENEKSRWQLYIQRIEGLIDEDTMKAEQSKKEAIEREKALKKAIEQEEENEAAKEEAIKKDPFSQQNLYQEEVDPFSEIMLLEMTDMYGDIDGEVWSQAVTETNEIEEDLDIFDSLLNDLDVDLLGDF